MFCILSNSIWIKVENILRIFWVSSFFAQLLCGKQYQIQIFWNFHRWERKQGFQKVNFWWVISRMQRNGIVHAAVIWWLAVTSKSVLGNCKQIHHQWVFEWLDLVNLLITLAVCIAWRGNFFFLLWRRTESPHLSYLLQSHLFWIIFRVDNVT